MARSVTTCCGRLFRFRICTICCWRSMDETENLHCWMWVQTRGRTAFWFFSILGEWWRRRQRHFQMLTCLHLSRIQVLPISTADSPLMWPGVGQELMRSIEYNSLSNLFFMPFAVLWCRQCWRRFGELLTWSDGADRLETSADIRLCKCPTQVSRGCLRLVRILWDLCVQSLFRFLLSRWTGCFMIVLIWNQSVQ